LTRYWCLSLGSGGTYVEPARRGGYIAVGWNELGNSSWLIDAGEDKAKTRNKFDSEFERLYPGSSIKVSTGAGQCWNFIANMTEGDIVLLRDPVRRRVHIAKITGGYVFRETP
jgi:predicted Mrr-cat superfamily restriction endonuclease